ncbi:hypothetical protein [Bradyrhizobium sp. LA6.10]|uniref:hypothetical protein n=1 Tax=Bradyrhizobium sp. LA6.10 TaxID=3156318 RepID=UPI003391F59A
MTMLRWLIQEPGEPEAFKDSFEPLFANDCGDQRNGLLPMDGEADVRRLLKQEVQQGRKVSNVVAYGRDRIIGEIGRQIRIRRRIKVQVDLGALLDRLSY